MISVSGPIGLIALALPLTALATTVFLATRPRSARRGPRPMAPAAAATVTVAPAPAAVVAPDRPVISLVPPDPAPRDGAKPAKLPTNLSPAIQLMGLAEQHQAQGDTAAAASAYRDCIRAAATSGARHVEARARVALGDIAQGSGDLTTACEHWQMARKLYFDLKDAGDPDHDALAGIEQRMRANGCPTDWVLNDF